MFFFNDDDGQERYGTVIASLGLDPKKVTEGYLDALKKEFGCVFEKGQLLIWVQESEERAEQIFEILRKRHFPIEEKNKRTR
jgi:hypothetical protein